MEITENIIGINSENITDHTEWYTTEAMLRE
jgi:hypothetical protein